jgi:hypothetical protein
MNIGSLIMKENNLNYFTKYYSYHPSVIPSLIEIISVYKGIKPGCRITVKTKNINYLLSYLTSMNLSYQIKFELHTIDNSFLTTSISERKLLIKNEIVYVYVARSITDSRALMNAETIDYDYSSLGKLLGYPDCCVNFATTNDKMSFDVSNKITKQTNLVLLSLNNSKKCDYRCNNLICQSSISYNQPLNLFSHYPCSLNCTKTISYSNEVLKWINHLFPKYYDNLVEMLNYSVLYWADDNLSAKEMTEFYGLAIVGGNFEMKTKKILKISNIITLDKVVSYKLKNVLDSETIIFNCDCTIFEGPTNTNIFSNSYLKYPSFIDWKTNTIISNLNLQK